MQPGPREIITPYRSIPLVVPQGMKHNEFFNSTQNLDDLVNNNGLLMNSENLVLYRKALGHSTEFDCSIIYNTSKTILNPLGRPVRRTQVADDVKHVWNRMNRIIIDYMLEQYPDPHQALILAGEASRRRLKALALKEADVVIALDPPFPIDTFDHERLEFVYELGKHRAKERLPEVLALARTRLRDLLPRR